MITFTSNDDNVFGDRLQDQNNKENNDKNESRNYNATTMMELCYNDNKQQQIRRQGMENHFQQ